MCLIADMSFAMEDHVESGWVAVRPNAFEERERHKFVFIVAWNEVEGKFAVTCHNRTAQRRSFGRDAPGQETGLDGDKTKCPECPVGASGGRGATRAAVSCGCSPQQSELCAETKLSPFQVLSSPSLDSLGPEDYSWAGLFSFQDLRAAHLQLCAVNSDLEPCLPPFPEEQSGVWSVLFGAPGVSQRETDALCYQLQVYLGHALDTCGWKILSEVLFSESEDTEEYYESLSELRQKGYEDALGRAKRSMQEVTRRMI